MMGFLVLLDYMPSCSVHSSRFSSDLPVCLMNTLGYAAHLLIQDMVLHEHRRLVS